MSDTSVNFAVGHQVKVLFGPFQGVCGEVVEVHRQATELQLDETRQAPTNRLLVKLDLRGRNVVVDFSPHLVADHCRSN